MNALGRTVARAKTLWGNKGHLRLFVVVSLVWMVFAGVAFWKPLPFIASTDLLLAAAGLPQEPPPEGGVDFDAREAEVCGGINFIPFNKASEDRRMECARNLRAQVENEVAMTRILQIARWLFFVTLVPIFIPLAAFFGVLIFEWIKEGYGAKPFSEV